MVRLPEIDVNCPKCSKRNRLSEQELGSIEKLKAILCKNCGKSFDARPLIALAQKNHHRNISLEEMASDEAVELLAKELGVDAAFDVDKLWRKLPGKIGHYEILSEINRGGMGIVYKAMDPQLRRPVAIKVLLSGDGASEEDVKRFHREAQAAARLQHPNIIPIYAVGIHEGRPYFVMDFVEGKTAKQLKEAGVMTPRLALTIIEGAAHALHHAHLHGVVHRDVKPANIIVDSNERVQLMDFGLARRIDEDLEITQSGTTMGTPSYMSPEQAEGNLAEVDAQSDVYSLGACMYELLTGFPPFEGPSTMAILRKVLDEPPRPPRKRNPKIHRDVETICLKCLEKAKKNRYGNAKVLADDIRHFNAGEAITAKPLGRIATLFRKAQRHKEVTIAAAIMVLSGLGALGYALRQAQLVSEEQVRERESNLQAAEQSGKTALHELGRDLATLEQGDFNATLKHARAMLAEAETHINKAAALAPDKHEVKQLVQRLKTLDTELEVKRYTHMARGFLRPPLDAPSDPNFTPNYAAAQVCAQLAVERDPENSDANKILREAVGMCAITIDTGDITAEVSARRIVDMQGRAMAYDANDIGKKLGSTPLKNVEFECGVYVLTFVRQGSPRQQATLPIPRDIHDEDRIFRVSLTGLGDNMAQVSGGTVVVPGSGTQEIAGFSIDRFEYPNRPGVTPLTGVTIVEAMNLCTIQQKHLCTTAQWLRACAGSSGRAYPYGSTYQSGACATGFDGDSQRRPLPSGVFARCRTTEGVYDMAGNVGEWTNAEPGERVLGGDWTGSLKFSELTGSCRTSTLSEEVQKERLGFRCCRK